MAMIDATRLEPDFYRNFHCVADRCRSNCCSHPWAITMDKATYKKFRKLREPQWLAAFLNDYIHRLKESTQDGLYAQILQESNGRCKLQTEEGLCRIHSELGEGYLCTTCRMYPRYHTAFPQQHGEERTVCVSCEEVARMLLNKSEPIQFEATLTQLPDNLQDHFYRNYIVLGDWSPDHAIHHYYLVRSICIALLQAREYTIEQRMMLLMLYLDKLDKLDKAGNTDAFPQQSQQFVEAVEQKLYDPLLNKDFEVEAAKLLALFGSTYFVTTTTEHERDIRESWVRANENLPYDQCMAHYRSYMASRQYFLEHILVNTLFMKQIPFHGEYSINQCMQYMACIFAIYRCLLAGYLTDRGGSITDTQLIDFTALFGKGVLHDNKSFDTNLELLEKNHMTTLPHLLAIIKG